MKTELWIVGTTTIIILRHIVVVHESVFWAHIYMFTMTKEKDISILTSFSDTSIQTYDCMSVRCLQHVDG